MKSQYNRTHPRLNKSEMVSLLRQYKKITSLKTVFSGRPINDAQ